VGATTDLSLENAAVFIDFRRRLLLDHSGPVYLIVDGHPANRAPATSEFVSSTEGRPTTGLS